MRFTSLMDNDDIQTIDQDGKIYKFKPGKEGMLTATDKSPKPKEPLYRPRPKAKTIMSPDLQVGSVRG